MQNEECNLNWNTYSEHIRDMLQDVMKSNDFTDITLVSDDKRQFRAHKLILSACSSALKKIIQALPENDSCIFLRGIQNEEVQSILEFM